MPPHATRVAGVFGRVYESVNYTSALRGYRRMKDCRSLCREVEVKGVPEGFWAKIHRDCDGRTVAWHPLQAHCAEVAAVTEVLLRETVLRHRFGRLLDQQSVAEPQIARLSVLATLHDAGKVNHGFQDRAKESPTLRTGHVSPFVDFMCAEDPEKQQIIQALGLREMADWFRSEQDLVAFLLATFAHHGRPVSPGHGFRPDLWRPKGHRNPMAGIGRLREAAARWFPAAFSGENTPFPPSPALQHAFNGLVTLADWIASDEQIFPYANEDTEWIEQARKRAQLAIQRLGLNPDGARASMGSARPGFKTVSDHSPRPIQQVCTDLADHPEGSLTILESETGSGKTEAALSRFAQLFHAGLVDGLYFALPTRTAATQIHERVLGAVGRAFPNPESCPPVVLAVPGYLTVDEKIGRRLAPFEVLWDDNERDRWHYRGWAAERPKRYLAGTVAVGTIDQVLLSTLQVKHAHLRATALLRHLLVVDEVHASDAYMTRLLDEVLTHHLAAGGHAFLMSATLGSVAQSRLLHDSAAAPPTPDEARALHYPLVTDTGADREKIQRTEAQPCGQTKEVEIETRPIAARPRECALLALDAALQGARVLVVRNTVSDCVATQRALERAAATDGNALFRVDGVRAPHHGRFATPDRKLLDRCVEDAFKPRSTSNGVVLIATQTVEQSLDIDADLMLTDLCPADVLLQRIGRLHRHRDRVRPPAFQKPRCLVLVPEEHCLETYIRSNGGAYGPHGLGTVYEDLRSLEATWRLAEQHATWDIPEMNRELVENTTHPDVLMELADSLGGQWKEHEQHVLGIRFADHSHAGLLLLPRRDAFGEDTFPADPDERIRTRLGTADRRVRFEKCVRSPFGEGIHELTLPACYAPEADEEAVPRNVAVEDGVVSFVFGGEPFLYDRLGLRRADFPCKEELTDE